MPFNWPQGLCFLHHPVLPPYLVAVVEKRSKKARVEVVQHRRQEVLVELERVGKLFRDLPDAVDELQEDGGPVRVVVLVVAVADPLPKLVAKTQPLLLY